MMDWRIGGRVIELEQVGFRASVNRNPSLGRAIEAAIRSNAVFRRERGERGKQFQGVAGATQSRQGVLDPEVGSDGPPNPGSKIPPRAHLGCLGTR